MKNTRQNSLVFLDFYTKQKVNSICEKYGMSFEETKCWYDGYSLKNISIKNHRYVVWR